MSEQEPSIEKRLLLAIVLSMLILLGAPYFFEQPVAPEPASNQPPVSVPAQASPPQAPSPVREETGIEQERRGEERHFSVENSVMEIVFDSRGAVIEAITLKDYLTPDGEPLELLPLELPRAEGRPLQLSVGDEFIDQLIGYEAYAVTGATGERLQAPVTLTFELSVEDVSVRKVVEVPVDGYQLYVKTEVIRKGRRSSHRILVGAGLGPGVTARNGFAYPAAVWRSDGEATHHYDGDLDDGIVSVDAAAEWAGIDSKYFAMLLLSPALDRVEADLAQWEVDGEQRSSVRVRARVSSGSTGSEDVRQSLFVGPKEMETLTAAHPTFRDTVDYGWFAILVEPLLFGLKLFYSIIGNYGLAIIALTFAINLALFPLRYKQMASMSKMSALQPKIQSIQAKYKRLKRDDPRKQNMNKEVMDLYKEHGVNPLGGCLPLVFQMPILFAFYRMLDKSIELRGAPFVGWIQDLSQPDPLFITPLLMGATMVLQQRMTPSGGDPAQKRMMMFLPVIFTVMFLWVSSGLALYFLFSNLFAMMLQFLLQRWQQDAAGSDSGRRGKTKKPKRGEKK